MGFLDRLSGRVAYDPADDEDFEADDGVYDDYYEEDASSISPIHSVDRGEIARIVTVWVASYKEIRDFAVEFRDGMPVILNLSEAPDGERARIVDFALGLCFGLDGLFSRISEDVFLLTPHAVKLDSRGTDENHDFAH
ncbi:MAG: cell division protein SepF [Actinomycetaceae bacterium]|nr:cell division protein SepF [Arcanobacterium sp.]MDD7687365.1 cell division protein SepF [Actinomycetaceae bacterium]MDY5274134.1 cell division protein SepF [Arcanobacterium sp.]